MTVKLFAQAILKFLLGVVLVGVLIFVPAGTLAFFNGWLLMGILFVPMFCAGIVMMFKNPELLKSRLDAKEKQKDQSIVVKLSGLMFLAGFIVAGLDFRFGWFTLPKGVAIGGAVVFLVAYILYAEVLRENTYLSRTIQVQENQKVIDTGLYGIVRHPMYSATLLLFLAMLFLPAGTWGYSGGWLLIGLLFVPMLILGTVLAVKAPALLKKRIDHKEKKAKQKGVIALSGLMFPASFVLSALDYRFDWSTVPTWCVIAASVLFLLGYGGYAEVLRENEYLSRSVEVQEGQVVVDTGLYGVVRHPMYSVTLLLFLTMP